MARPVKTEFTRHELRAQALRAASVAPSKSARRIQRRAHIIARSSIAAMVLAAQQEQAQ
jgi:hypothetical protein